MLLFLVPFGYCIYKGDFKKGFWFTWIMWSIVWVAYTFFLPSIGYITMKATDKTPDISISCVGFMLGMFVGWLPALILASFGGFIHNIFFRK